MPVNNDRPAQVVANAYIKTIRLGLPEISQRIKGAEIDDTTGKLPNGQSVKEAAGQLKSTIEELSNLKQSVDDFVASPRFQLIADKTYESVSRNSNDPKYHFFAPEEPAAELERSSGQIACMIKDAENNLKKLASWHAPDLTNNEELITATNKEPPAYTAEPRPTKVFEKDAEGNRVIKGPNRAKIAKWKEEYATPPVKAKNEKPKARVKFADSATVHEYQSARHAAKDFSWVDNVFQESDPFPGAQITYNDDAKTADAGPDDISASGIHRRGAARYLDEKSVAFDINDALHSRLLEATNTAGKLEVSHLKIDSEDLRHGAEGINAHELEAEINSLGDAAAAHVRAVRTEKQVLESIDPKADKPILDFLGKKNVKQILKDGHKRLDAHTHFSRKPIVPFDGRDFDSHEIKLTRRFGAEGAQAIKEGMEIGLSLRDAIRYYYADELAKEAAAKKV